MLEQRRCGEGNHARLHRRLCSACNLTAAIPHGSFVRRCSISHTPCCDSPTCCPISASVMPVLRSAVTRSDHVMLSIARTVWHSQSVVKSGAIAVNTYTRCR